MNSNHHVSFRSHQDRSELSVALLLIRLVLGAVFLAHGSQKLFGAFGGPGLHATVQHMGPIGYLVAIGEFFGAIGLLLGILPRFSAAALIVIMIGAIVLVHAPGGFFAPKGIEFPLALIGLLIPILLAGAGRYSISENVSLSHFTSRNRNNLTSSGR